MRQEVNFIYIYKIISVIIILGLLAVRESDFVGWGTFMTEGCLGIFIGNEQVKIHV